MVRLPNPSGVNGFGGFGREAPYGSQREMESLTRAAPLPSQPALDAPRRAGRKAKRGPRAPQQPPPQVPFSPAGAPPQDFAYPMQLANIWRGVASEPGASDLVKTIAAQAIQEAQLG